MAILAVLIGSFCLFVWHGLSAYPLCSPPTTISTREDAIAYTMNLWLEQRKALASIDEDEHPFWGLVESEDFRQLMSDNWLVSSEPIFLNNRAWYVKYHDRHRHMSVAAEFDRCREPIKAQYYQVYDTLSRLML